MPDLPWLAMGTSLALAQVKVVLMAVEAAVVGDPLVAMCMMTTTAPRGNAMVIAPKNTLLSCKITARSHAGCAATDVSTRGLAALIGQGKTTAPVDMSGTCAPTARNPAMSDAKKFWSLVIVISKY